MRDIAQDAGVSRTTVSHILNGESDRGYNQTTTARVLAAARRLGYRRNTAALAVNGGRFSTLALLQDGRVERSILTPHLLLGLVERLTELGLLLTVASYDHQRPSASMPRVVAEIAADGLLVNYHTDLPTAMLETIRCGPMPAVWINRKDGSDSVWSDDAQAAAQAVEVLVRHGHRRIAYIDPMLHVGGEFRHYSRADRHAGYSRAMSACGLPTRSLSCASPLALDAYPQWYRSLLVGPDRPTACITNFWPATLAEVARTLGLTAPEQLALVSLVDPQPVHDVIFPSISPDWRGIGLAAVDLTLARIAQQGKSLPGTAVPPGTMALDLLRPLADS